MGGLIYWLIIGLIAGFLTGKVMGTPNKDVLVTIITGIIGAFVGAAVVVWNGLRHVPKREARAIVQPYILGLQLLSIALLALSKPETFGAKYWWLVAITVPIVLPCTLLGVKLYQQLSDVNFRRVTFILLGVSGVGLLIKAADTFPVVASAVKSIRL